MKILPLVPLAFLLGAAPAPAQNIFAAQKAGSQAVIERNEQGFSRCGIRILLRDETAKHHDFYDIDVSVLPPLKAGVIQLTRIRQTQAQLLKPGLPRAQGPAPVKFWIARDTAAKPLTPLEYVPSAAPGKMNAITSSEETRDMIVDIAGGKRIQFAARYPGQAGADRVVSFAAALPREDAATLDACLQSMRQ